MKRYLSQSYYDVQHCHDLITEAIQGLSITHSGEDLDPEYLTRSTEDTYSPLCIDRDSVLNILALFNAAFNLGKTLALQDDTDVPAIERFANDSWNQQLEDMSPDEPAYSGFKDSTGRTDFYKLASAIAREGMRKDVVSDDEFITQLRTEPAVQEPKATIAEIMGAPCMRP